MNRVSGLSTALFLVLPPGQVFLGRVLTLVDLLRVLVAGTVVSEVSGLVQALVDLVWVILGQVLRLVRPAAEVGHVVLLLMRESYRVGPSPTPQTPRHTSVESELAHLAPAGGA